MSVLIKVQVFFTTDFLERNCLQVLTREIFSSLCKFLHKAKRWRTCNQVGRWRTQIGYIDFRNPMKSCLIFCKRICQDVGKKIERPQSQKNIWVPTYFEFLSTDFGKVEKLEFLKNSRRNLSREDTIRENAVWASNVFPAEIVRKPCSGDPPRGVRGSCTSVRLTMFLGGKHGQKNCQSF